MGTIMSLRYDKNGVGAPGLLFIVSWICGCFAQPLGPLTMNCEQFVSEEFSAHSNASCSQPSSSSICNQFVRGGILCTGRDSTIAAKQDQFAAALGQGQYEKLQSQYPGKQLPPACKSAYLEVACIMFHPPCDGANHTVAAARGNAGTLGNPCKCLCEKVCNACTPYSGKNCIASCAATGQAPCAGAAQCAKHPAKTPGQG